MHFISKGKVDDRYEKYEAREDCEVNENLFPYKLQSGDSLDLMLQTHG